MAAWGAPLHGFSTHLHLLQGLHVLVEMQVLGGLGDQRLPAGAEERFEGKGEHGSGGHRQGTDPTTPELGSGGALCVDSATNQCSVM